MKKLFFVLTLFLLCQAALLAQSARSTLATKSNRNTKGVTATATIQYLPVYFDGQIHITLDGQVDINTNEGFSFNGKHYPTTSVPGLSTLLNKAKGDYPEITFRVYYNNLLRKEIKRNVTLGMGLGSLVFNDAILLPCTKEEGKNPGGWRLEAVAFHSFSYKPITLWMDFEYLIKDYEQEQRAQEKYRNEVRAGDAALQQKDFATARKHYYEAGRSRPDERYPKDQLAKINELVKQGEQQEQHRELMKLAGSAMERETYGDAISYYRQAVKLGVDVSAAQSGLRRAESALSDQKRKAEQATADRLKKQKEEKESADRDKKAADELLQVQQKMNEELEELKKEEEAQLRKELDKEQQQQLKQQEQEAQKKRDEEYREAQAQKKKAEQEKDRKRQDELNKSISRFERHMSFDPELYLGTLQKAEASFNKYLAVKPASALQLKESWWDRNMYMEPFRDDLNEPKRRESFQNYQNLLAEKGMHASAAKYYYLEALQYVDRDSREHKYLLGRIEWMERIDKMQDKHLSISAEFEEQRRTIREHNKVTMAINRQRLNAGRANLAYSWLDYQHYSTGKAPNSDGVLQKKADLERRMNEADQQYLQDMAITGITTEAVNSVMFDENKKAHVYANRSSGINARLYTGWMGLPVTANETSDDNQAGYSYTENMYVFPVHAGLDFWLYRSRGLDIGLSAGGMFGVLPMMGYKNLHFSYHGTAKMNLGVKHFKLALEGSYLHRYGSYYQDRDVAYLDASGGLNPYYQATGAIAEGELNYSLLRAGAGFHIDFSDAYGERYFRALCYAEKPSFVTNFNYMEPVYSYTAEFLFGGGFSIGFDYADKYVVGGVPKYSMAEAKDRTFWSARMGKIFTLTKSKGREN